MAGYKSTIIDDGALALWSFDGDIFDGGSHTSSSLVILDDIDNTNPANLVVDNLTYHGYRLGVPSLVGTEQIGQSACYFGFQGYQSSHPSKYASAYISIPNSSTFDFPNKGSFTVEFLFAKTIETDFMTRPEHAGLSLIRPIGRKTGMFDVTYRHPWTSSPYLHFDFLDGQVTYDWAFASYNDKTLHLTMVWDAVETAPFVFVAVASIYINGRKIFTQTKNYTAAIPLPNNPSSFEFGGRSGATNSSLDDRNTSTLKLDQIAVYDYALDKYSVAKHYRKVWNYTEMLKNAKPLYYWPFDDNETVGTYNILPAVGSVVGVGIGGGNIQREQTGPSQLPASRSTRFLNNSQADFDQYAGVALSITSDYAIELWFSSTTTSRGTILSSQFKYSPFAGPYIEWNVLTTGCIRYHETQTNYVDSSTLVSGENKFHHVVVQRVGGAVQIWVDGTMHDERAYASVSASISELYLMNSLPGNMGVNGCLAHFALYPFSLQEQEIKMRAEYSTIYKIKGQTLLAGVPYGADLRFYDHITGELLLEEHSNPDNGNYSIDLIDNRLIDIMVFDKNDANVRYRAFGPVTPAETIDTP